jgi:hypothetical protein
MTSLALTLALAVNAQLPTSNSQLTANAQVGVLDVFGILGALDVGRWALIGNRALGVGN